MLGFLVGASETDKCPMCKHRFKYGLLKKLKEGENLHKHFLLDCEELSGYNVRVVSAERDQSVS